MKSKNSASSIQIIGNKITVLNRTCLANNNQKDELASMSYVDNYIPQERNEAEFDEEILLEENDVIYNLYASTNEYTDNGHKDDHPSGATKVRFIIRTNLVQNSNNRGRMVIGDIDYKYGV